MTRRAAERGFDIVREIVALGYPSPKQNTVTCANFNEHFPFLWWLILQYPCLPTCMWTSYFDLFVQRQAIKQWEQKEQTTRYPREVHVAPWRGESIFGPLVGSCTTGATCTPVWKRVGTSGRFPVWPKQTHKGLGRLGIFGNMVYKGKTQLLRWQMILACSVVSILAGGKGLIWM